MRLATPDLAEPITIEPAPGVYAPAADSQLLRETFAERGPLPEALVLDACCGSGFQGIAAARAGHRVVSVDSHSSAAKAALRNAQLNDVELEVMSGHLFEPVDGWRFDAVLINPPYVPLPPGESRTAWCDGGPDGRTVIDEVCAKARRVLAPDGKLWMVHSSLANIPRSLSLLERAGFVPRVVASRPLELGPVSRPRRQYFVDQGYLDADSDHEELAVIEARVEA